MNVLCSWRLARRVWSDYPAFGLSYLSGELGLDLDHHEAGSDAAACAAVVLAAQRYSGASDLNDLRSLLDMPLGSLSADSFVGVGTSGTVLNNEGDRDADPNHPLYGLTLCFTGAMYSMTRREAAELITDVGADFKNSVSTKIDLLVVGDADFVQFADGHQTGKMKRAAKLKSDGEDIEIVTERDFLALL
jgi:DNA polymerase-3 subunit epsilon